ncbi:hypothetical protein GX50_08698 [[Emmonsia] crescens]|uniref:Uncharacterized protein n=1 Tax=[Emmonsia] crescens TaxID=73230 RepID=A0A2B7Z6A7_9EURO|nr:hypothetical protein GX50_08698 [Emmonsia crescens]
MWQMKSRTIGSPKDLVGPIGRLHHIGPGGRHQLQLAARLDLPPEMDPESMFLKQMPPQVPAGVAAAVGGAEHDSVLGRTRKDGGSRYSSWDSTSTTEDVTL